MLVDHFRRKQKDYEVGVEIHENGRSTTDINIQFISKLAEANLEKKNVLRTNGRTGCCSHWGHMVLYVIYNLTMMMYQFMEKYITSYTSIELLQINCLFQNWVELQVKHSSKDHVQLRGVRATADDAIESNYR